jgi:hypothetical protein
MISTHGEMYNDNSQRQNIMQKATVSNLDYPEGQGVPAPLVGSYIYSTFKDREILAWFLYASS